MYEPVIQKPHRSYENTLHLWSLVYGEENALSQKMYELESY